jgi:hypothetical protein
MSSQDDSKGRPGKWRFAPLLSEDFLLEAKQRIGENNALSMT